MEDLAGRLGALNSHTLEKCKTVARSLNLHARRRVALLYPAALHAEDSDAILFVYVQRVNKQREETVGQNRDSVLDMKQSTARDVSRSMGDFCIHVRPSPMSDTGEAASTFAGDVIVEHATAKMLNMTVRMNIIFEDQFVSEYMG